MTDSQWGQLALWATTVAGFLVVEWRAARNRRWAIEDKRAATAEIIERAAAEAEATRIKTEAIADQLRRHTELTAAQLREEARIGADALVHEAALIAAKLETKTTAQIEEQRQQAAELAKQVAEVKVAAHDAYKEANNVNIKIEDLNQRLVTQQRIADEAPAAAVKTIEKIDATTERIEAKVDADAEQGR